MTVKELSEWIGESAEVKLESLEIEVFPNFQGAPVFVPFFQLETALANGWKLSV